LTTERLEALLTPFVTRPLPTRQQEELTKYLDLLLKWNEKISLTSIRDSEEIVRRHFGESLFAATRLLTAETVKVIDVGSGAGFPGLPMAISAPHTKFTLIESQAKKATFLKEVVRTLALKNVTVFAGRAEDFTGSADLVTMRAVEQFVRAIPAAVRLINANGRLALLSTEDYFAILSEAAHRESLEVIESDKLPMSASRMLFTARKAA